MTFQQMPIPDLFRSTVASVSTKLLPKLQAYDGGIQLIQFMHGHYEEVKQILKQFTENETLNNKKFPLVVLLHDYPIKMGQTGIYGEGEFHLLICTTTDPTFNSDDRYAKTFNPVLTPIYKELMHQIAKNGIYFLTQGEGQIQHTMIERLYWGRSGVYGNVSNIFNDWIDCIEITNLSLKINNVHCQPGSTGKLNSLQNG